MKVRNGIVFRSQFEHAAIRRPCGGATQHLARLEDVVGLLAMPEQRLKHSAFAIRTDEGQRLVAARHFGLRGDQRLDRATVLLEVQLVDHSEVFQSRRDRMFERRDCDIERPKRIVPALGFVLALMIPNTQRDLAILGPVRLAAHRQREVKRARVEVNEEHSSAVLHEVHERGSRGITERLRVMPVDVVRNEQVVVLGNVLLPEVFNVERDIDLDARVAFQRRFDGRSGLLPVVPLVSVIAREQEDSNGFVIDLRALRPLDADERLRDLGMREVPRLNAAGGDIDLRGPSDRIEDQPTKIVLLPVGVKVSASRAEPATAGGSLLRPSDDVSIWLATTESGNDEERTQSLRFRTVIRESQIEIELFLHLERLHAAQDRVLGSPQRDVGFLMSDRRVPLLLAVGLPIKVRARPIEDLLRVLIRGERRKVKGQKPAAAIDLFLDSLEVLVRAKVRSLLIEVTVASVRDDHDGVGIIERLEIAGHAVEVILNAHLLADIRVIEHHLEQLDGPGIVMNPIPRRPMRLRPGNEHDFLRWEFGSLSGRSQTHDHKSQHPISNEHHLAPRTID